MSQPLPPSCSHALVCAHARAEEILSSCLYLLPISPLFLRVSPIHLLLCSFPLLFMLADEEMNAHAPPCLCAPRGAILAGAILAEYASCVHTGCSPLRANRAPSETITSHTFTHVEALYLSMSPVFFSLFSSCSSPSFLALVSPSLFFSLSSIKRGKRSEERREMRNGTLKLFFQVWLLLNFRWLMRREKHDCRFMFFLFVYLIIKRGQNC